MAQPNAPRDPRFVPTPMDQPFGRARHVIVAGFGPVGRLVAEQLEERGVHVVIVELNLQTIERQLSRNKRVVYGDVTDEATLRSADIDEADALILTVPDEDVALEACRVARRLHPGLYIAARTNFLSKGMLCSQAGADDVIVEEVVTAEAMRDAVAAKLLTRQGPTPGDGQPGG